MPFEFLCSYFAELLGDELSVCIECIPELELLVARLSRLVTVESASLCIDLSLAEVSEGTVVW